MFSLLWNTLHDFFSSHFLKKVNYFLNFMFINFLLLFIILLNWYFTLDSLFLLFFFCFFFYFCFSYFVNLYKLKQIYIFICNLFLMPYFLFLRFIYSWAVIYSFLLMNRIPSHIIIYLWVLLLMDNWFVSYFCTNRAAMDILLCVSRYTSFSRVNAKQSICCVIDILILSFVRSWQYFFLKLVLLTETHQQYNIQVFP